MICISRFYNGQGYFRALCYYRKTLAKLQFSIELRNLIFRTNTFSCQPFKLFNKKNVNLLNRTKQDKHLEHMNPLPSSFRCLLLFYVLFTATILCFRVKY